ncbi:winged helix-turn-helix domain-containing protein [Methylobacterium durans]|uniref:OmpR/PhoB-type domain-containing protein n=1 Tax=Methylobacterium durans TaxID=2202825 RepID=A0A2U8WC00_9HYPH|nr:winged helix-turn-helix domain-containing protein [Methylobacterium durans]AWN43131.1 hypothetical protein DK389_24865 [Methylobacterium durans]
MNAPLRLVTITRDAPARVFSLKVPESLHAAVRAYQAETGLDDTASAVRSLLRLGLRPHGETTALKAAHAAQCAEYEARIADLEEALRQARAAEVPSLDVPGRWGLTTREAQLLTLLRARAPRMVLRLTAMSDIYGPLSRDALDPKGLDVPLCFLRRKLAAAGVPVAIRTRRGLGWQISESDALVLDAAIAAEARRTA